jgi:GDP-mannose 6-dehydrogenase
MNICIVGLGYVGTVSAACLADQGHRVWGVDINAEKVRIINQGCSPIVEDGLADKIAKARRSGRLYATGNIDEALRETELCFLAVATPSRPNGEVDPAHLMRACEQISHALVKTDGRQIVVVRSSILPSVLQSCEDIFSTIAPGRVELCVNPEFLREGTAIRDFEEPSFTLLGLEDPSVERALRSLYKDINAPICVLPPKEALLVKYASNAYHALKVAFANEIGALCQRQDIDARAVMSVFCKETKLNISARYLMPGFAFGGSCLPKDVRALLYAAKQSDVELPVIQALLVSNKEVVERAVRQVVAKGLRSIGLIGLSFKSNTDDLRESPFVEIAERLLGKGYELKIYDPNVSLARLTGSNKEYIESVIPHIARLLVPSLDELASCKLILVGHHYSNVDAFLADTGVEVIDFAGQDRISPQMEQRLAPKRQADYTFGSPDMVGARLPTRIGEVS